MSENINYERGANLSAAKRALLERRLRGEPSPADAARRGIPRRKVQSPVPLSFAQQRLWFLDRLEPGSPFYSMSRALRLNGALDVLALERTFNEVVRRHEVLRTRFALEEGKPVQVVEAEMKFRLGVEDLQHLPAKEREARAQELIEQEALRPFDLSRGPLMRARLLRFGPEDHALLFSMHHIVSDGWSMDILVREVSRLYAAFARGEASPLPPLPVQYADFALWQRQRLTGATLERQLDYWKRQLDGAPQLLDLPTDYPRPAVRSPRGARLVLPLSRELTASLKELSGREGTTLFMTLLAAFNVLLQRYTRRDDLLVGTAIAGRSQVELEGLIGFFVNFLVLRADLSGDPSFRELLRRVRETALGAFAHQELPFERLVEELNPERSSSHAPLVQVGFGLESAFGDEQIQSLFGVSSKLLLTDNGTAKFDLVQKFIETENGLVARLDYSTELFEPETAERMLRHLGALLSAAAADPALPLSRLPLMGDEERRRLVTSLNRTRREFPRGLCAHELFERQADARPEAAAAAEAATGRSLSYAELDRRANQLAHHLRGLGVGPEVAVGVCLERSAELPVALLGVLKAGGVYLPLDPSSPLERLALIVEQTQVPVLVTQEHLLDRLPVHWGQVVTVDGEGWAEVERESVERPEGVGVGAENLAYVIYTSGSTGRPKGVQLAHRGLVNMAQAQLETFSVGAEDRILQFSSLSFDASVFEMVMSFAAGATLCFAPREELLPGPSLVGLLRGQKITSVTLPPTVLALSPDAPLPDLRTVIVAGEECSAELVGRWAAGRRLFNAYGPTETTVWATVAECFNDGRKPPIGRPVQNVQVYVLDGAGEPVPVGVPGELYLGGEGLARCYLDLPGLTAERFVPDPFGGEPGARLYRSGDLARHLPDGQLEFLGRADRQVKVRGFRIELEEIEAVLRQHGSVRGCAVLAREDAPGDKRLVAYVVTGEGTDPASVSELRSHLGEKLPDYMMPAAFVFLDTFPLLPSGKIDRRSLPAPGSERPRLEQELVTPRGVLEEWLAGKWREALDIEQVGVDDNFFELGGDSIKAAVLANALQNELGEAVQVVAVFSTPTVATFARYLEETYPEAQARLLRSARPHAAQIQRPDGEGAPSRPTAEVEAARPALPDDDGAGGWPDVLTQEGAEGVSPESFASRALPDALEGPEASGNERAGAGPRQGLVPLARASESRNQFPLSFAQERLWFLSELEPESPFYNCSMAVRLTGRLDIAALERALGEVIRRHQVLRTVFPMVDGSPVQVVQPAEPFRLSPVDLGGLGESECEAEVRRLIASEARRGFDLKRGPLLRASLMRLGEGEHVALLVMHHIVSDGWSMDILVREVSRLYAAFARGEASPLPPLPVQYADFALWQRQRLTGATLERQLDYWKRQLDGAPSVLELPTDRPRPAQRAYRGAARPFAVNEATTRKLKELCHAEGVTTFMLLLAAFQTLLHRYTGRPDIVVGTPVASRNRSELEGLIGFFANTLVLRADLSGDPSFRELLRRVRETALGAFAHQELPFERLVEELQPERSLSHTPLFQVMFALQNAPRGAAELPGLTMSAVGSAESGTEKFDLTLIMAEAGGALSGALSFNTELFEPETAERMLRHLGALLSAAAADPALPLSRLPLMGDEERRRLVTSLNRTRREFPRGLCAHELFERQADARPEAAAAAEAATGRSLSYAELDRRANQLAHHLRGLGVGPEVAVGVCLERSAELPVALLGVLKAGGVYLPLDPTYPLERLSLMIEQTQTPVLVVQEELEERLPAHWGQVVRVDGGGWEELEREESCERLAGVGTHAEGLAYVIYTSGSTGVPKGIGVTHRAISRLVCNTDYVELGADDRVAQISNASFDALTFELWGALLHGAQLVIIDKAVAISPREFSSQLAAWQVTTTFLTTALFNQVAHVAPSAFRSLRYVLFGGEAVDPASVREVLAGGKPRHLLHVYGPTENTTFSTWFEVEEVAEGAQTVPIGRPISNTQAYVLDGAGGPVPVGVPGELYLGGEGLARGYLDGVRLTAERFVPDPFGGEPGARLYRTGDVVRHLPDGAIEFLGRADHQVKLRGFRIELGEIEAAISSFPQVGEVAVVVRADDHADKRLVAYFTPRGGAPVAVEELRGFLLEKLPGYMVPAVYVRLDALPLTPNGKVDRKALPAPAEAGGEMQAGAEAGYVPPRDELERRLAGIWEDVLGVRRVGVRDNFFTLGGHSLLAVNLFAQVEKQFGRALPLVTLFQSPTVEQLAEALRGNEPAPSAAWSSLVPIRPEGTKPPFFYVHGGGGNILPLRNLTPYLDPDQPYYGLQSQGLDGKTEPFTRIEDMAAHYIKEIVTLQPEGPYLIGGFCYGGTVAFEMAQQLRAQSKEVALVAIVDAGVLRPTSSQAKLTVVGNRLLHPLGKLEQKLRDVRDAGWREYALKRARSLKASVRGRLRFAFDRSRDAVDPLVVTSNKVSRANVAALKRYWPQVYPGRVTLFWATGSNVASAYKRLGWSDMAAEGLEVHLVPGKHLQIGEEPYVKVLGEKLTYCINRALAEAARRPRAA